MGMSNWTELNHGEQHRTLCDRHDVHENRLKEHQRNIRDLEKHLTWLTVTVILLIIAIMLVAGLRYA